MLGRTSSLPITNHRHLVTAAIAAIATVIVLAMAPAPAHAAGCTDSWTNTTGGSWFEGSNWSKKAPPSSEEEACITAEGTYTVAMTQTSATVSVKSLTVGGSSGTQTLVVGSSCSVNAVLTTTAGISIGAQGAMTLTNGDGCGDGVKLVGPITNAGSITSEPLHGGARELQGSVTNTGTLTFNAGTAYNGSKGALVNEGALSVAEGVVLTVSNGSSVTNGSGGKISGGATGDVLMDPGTSFSEGAGTTSGTKPVILDDAALSYSGAGESAIAMRGESSALSGNLASGQSLSVESTCSENTKVTASASFTNGGAITLTNGDGCGDNVTLAISAGTLTNSGTITTQLAHGGTRTLQGSVTNTGTLTFNVSTAYNGSKGALVNEGALSVAEGVVLTVSNGSSVTNGSGGKISGGATGDVFMGSGTSFTEGAGTTSGTKPVILDDAVLSYTGTGESLIALRGESSTSGNLSSAQSLSIESTCSENAKTTATASFTNGGTVTLTNGDGCGNNATLAISAGTLTNSGTITTETDHGGTRQIQGSITNTGKLAINSFVAYNGAGAALKNEGVIDIAEAKQLTVSNAGSVTDGTGGEISAGKGADLFAGSGTSFTQGAGTTSGGTPVVVDDGTLNYTGTGASQISLRGTGTLTGSIAAGQSLLIGSTCSENAVVTAAASYTNAGTITLTNADGCGNSATLTTSAGTLTNSGKIVTEPDHGGTRSLQGNLTNTGTLILNTATGALAAGATLLNEGAIDIATGVAFSIGSSATVTNGPGGLIDGTGTGALVQSGGTFNEGLGAVVGGEPVILDDLTLNYTEHGSGPIALRGSSTLGTGNVKSGEVLLIESTCSENAVVTAAGSFTNNGTIELTNGDGCGNSATLNLKGGTLTNIGALNVDNPHGGSRAISGNLLNTDEGVILLAAGETLQVTGNYTQTSLAKLKTTIAGTSDFGALSVSGSAALGGKLKLIQSPTFKGSLEQKFAIVTSGSLTGAFALETEGQLNASGLYYKPTYSSTAATLVVTQATLSLTSTSGPPGSTTTVTGAGFLPGDTIELKFSDRLEAKTVYPSVTVNGSGEFSAEITIPAKAALKGGEVKAVSVQTGAKLGTPFTVT